MILMGIGDEAGAPIDAQIKATRDLGWQNIEMRAIEVPGYAKGNFHDIPEAAFDLAVDKLQKANIHVYCFGSAVMNWAKKIEDPFEITLGEVKRAIPRMQKLGTEFVRIMSLKPKDEDAQTPPAVYERVREVTKMFLDGGIQPVHENCMNYGGMSSDHALEVLEKCPGLKWVFDTANPIFNFDRRGPAPWKRQEAWQMWTQLRDSSHYLHNKHPTWTPAKNCAVHEWPGEGYGPVRDILKDSFARGYDAAISIEPHKVVV